MTFTQKITVALAVLHIVQVSQAADVTSKLDVIYAKYGERKVHLDLFSIAATKKSRPAIVLVHGGGWLKGNKTKFHPLAKDLARRGYVVAAIEYRLGGEAKFPAAVHDCMASVRWLRANHKRLNIDPKRIAAVGGSAGGHLVGLMATASHLKQFQGKGGNANQSSRIFAAVVMAGPMVLDKGSVARKSRKQTEKSNANKWFGKTIDQAPELYRLASPLTHVSSKTPPVLFQTGQFDQPQRNQEMRTALRRHKIATGLRVYKAGKHGCWNRQDYRHLFVDDIDIFLREALNFNSVPFATLPARWGSVEFYRDRMLVNIDRKVRDNVIHLLRLNTRTRKAYPEGKPKQKIPIRPGLKTWALRLSPQLNKSGTRIVVETIGQPVLGRTDMVVTPKPNGEIVLPAHQATVTGTHLRYEPQPHKNTVGYWTNPKDHCRWHFFVSKPGKYDVVLFQGCGKGHGGSEVAAVIGKTRLKFVVEDTGHFQNFKDRKIGTVTFDKPTTSSIALIPIKKAKVAIMDVRRIRLVPAK